MAKAINEKDPEQIREENEQKHRKKREEEDKMKDKNRKRAERMERINPGHVPYPMSIEEAEEIEVLLVDVTDEEITEEKIKTVKESIKKGKEKEGLIKKQKEDGNLE